LNEPNTHVHDGPAATGSVGDYQKPPEDDKEWQQYWIGEFAASDKMLRKFHKRGHRIVERFLDDRRDDGEDTDFGGGTRLNLFHANIQTVQGLMYGQIPRVDVSRRYADPNDDIARVASMILERMLNNCVADPGDDYRTLLKDALQDRLIPGLGAGRARYSFESEKVAHEALSMPDAMGELVELAPAYEEEIILNENCPTTYINWKDLKWSYSRTWSELRWISFRSYMNYQAVEERFGEKVAKKISFKNVKPNDTKNGDANDTDYTNPEPQAEIWEIWNKEDRKVYWYTAGMSKILESMDDPLGLSSFWPCPPFLAANTTTTLFVPKADFLLAQDLYDEIDALSTRIELITSAIRAVGVYDKSADGIQRIFTEAVENELIPVDNWAMFAEKGGLKGQIEWMPITDLVNTVDTLRGIREETIKLLYQVTGMSDIMRGQSEQYTSASSDQLKTKFGSARMQVLQEEFAEFATNLMKMKAEIISLHFDPQTIVKQSNIDKTQEDPQIIQQAIQLIKEPDMLQWKIIVRPESIAMVDYQSLQAERTEYLTAVATYLQSSAPMLERLPDAAPVLMELLKWGLAGFKGSQEIEGVIDKALDSASKAPPPGDKPDPAMEKAKMDMEKVKLSMQQDAQKHKFAMELAASNHQADMREIMGQLQAKMQEISVESDANIRQEEAQAAFNIAELQMKDRLDHKDHIRDMEMQRAKKVDSRPSDS